MLSKLKLGSWRPNLRVALLAAPWIVLSSVGAFADGKGLDLSRRFLGASETVFRGRLVDRKCFVNEETGDILTRYLFQVDGTLKGPQSSLLEIVEYGGSVDGVTMVVPHAANYQSGTEYLVFSWRDDWGRQRTMGGSQGALPVLTDGQGKRAVRMMPDHPLRVLLHQPQGLFVDFQALSSLVADTSNPERER